MTAQITNATPYIIVSINGCGIGFSNIGPDLGQFARLFHLLVQVFTKNIRTKHEYQIDQDIPLTGNHYQGDRRKISHQKGYAIPPESVHLGFAH
jgi:hypothetical protein